MQSMFVFTGIITQDEGEEGYASLCPELNVASQGDTLEEARAMLLEAATLHIEGSIEDGLPYLRPVAPEDDPRNEEPGAVVDVFRFKVDVSVSAHV